MTLTLIPDIEKVASDYLRTHADIIALSTRIVGKSPDGKLADGTDGRLTSWVRVTDLGSPQVNQPDHLQETLLQLDCYAGKTGGQPEVNLLYRTVRAVLGTLPGTGGVTGVKVIDSARSLDTDLEPARDRRMLSVLVWSHA